MEINQNVMKRVQEHKDWLVNEKGYDENQIMAVAAYGSMNYGTFQDGVSDVDTKMIYLPSYEEIAFQRPVSREHHLPNEEHCEVKDIREMASMWRKQNINFLEILFTPYIIVNPRYKLEWKLLQSHAEQIAYMNMDKAVRSICGQAIHTLKQIKDYDKEGKKVANGLRLFFFLEDYIQHKKPYWDCIYISNEKEQQKIMEIKYGEKGHLYNKVSSLLLIFKSYQEEVYPGLNKEIDQKLYDIEYSILKKKERCDNIDHLSFCI